MDVSRNSEAAAANRTTVERRSDREVVVTRSFDAPARLVFEAWSNGRQRRPEPGATIRRSSGLRAA